ncbi:hypothetical protein DL96DRAFT_1060775 [Flagelloscypha sp. PMI_526]|nr:hypothetical protein DL96DRAFT_1060775 [Flagelloscypha sp. PMI_526]
MPLDRSFVRPWPEKINYEQQSVEVPGTRRPGQTGHFRNAIWGYVDYTTPNTIHTVDQIFNTGLSGGKDRPMLGHRPLISSNPLKYADHYVWETYGEVDTKRRALGSALDAMFAAKTLGGGEYKTLGLWSMNRPEWQIIDAAAQSYGMVSVSLYDTLGKDAVSYIINHAATSVVFSTANHLGELLKLKPSLPILKLIVSIDPLTPEMSTVLEQWSGVVGVKLVTLDEMYKIGQKALRHPIPAKPDELSSISYTSGTTGNPKGVLLTHGNLAMATQGTMFGLEVPDEGSVISYLPLAHIYGRAVELGLILLSGKIGFFTGDPLRLVEDIQILKPTYIPSVPRVLNRIYQSAMAAGNVPGLRGAIFRRAVATKLQILRETGVNTHAFWDKLVFRKIRAVLGGELMMVSSGSAPISPDVIDFLKIALSCYVFEGYGLTETCAVATRGVVNDPGSSGTIGPVAPTCEMKLVDVPEMNYKAEDKPYSRGEICIKGTHIFGSYYKDPENTKKALDDEGWFHTGDVGLVDDNGRFRIIDRVKNIMKLSQGEYVALEKIENTYSAVPCVSQLYVHGDSLQPYLVGVIVPDPVQLAAIASKVTGEQISPDDIIALEKVIQDDRVVQTIFSLLSKEGKKNGLKGFEMLKRIHVSLNQFSVEDNTLTPTFKIKRKDAYNKFKKELDALYALGEPKL